MGQEGFYEENRRTSFSSAWKKDKEQDKQVKHNDAF